MTADEDESDDDLRWELMKQARRSGISHRQLKPWIQKERQRASTANQNKSGHGELAHTGGEDEGVGDAEIFVPLDETVVESSSEDEGVPSGFKPPASDTVSEDQGDTYEPPGWESETSSEGQDDSDIEETAGLTPQVGTFGPKLNSLNSEEKVNLFVLATLSSQCTRSTFDALQHVPQLPTGKNPFKSQDRVHRALEREIDLKVKNYDMCQNSCRLYAGPYQSWDTNQACGLCGVPRQREGPWRYTHISLIDRLKALWANAATSTRLNYRCDNGYDSTLTQDIFDGEHYHNLKGSLVEWAGETQKHLYFSSPTDIALGFSTDRVPLFKRAGLDVWPLIITVYSLPPEMRWQRPFQICVGLIPGIASEAASRKGKKKPTKDFDSFLIPLMDELKELACEGVSAMRSFPERPQERIHFRAHVITVSGDMPAIAKMMNFKGHNAMFPCRCCTMPAIHVPPKGAYYMSVEKRGALGNPDYTCLPLRVDAVVKETVDQIEYHEEYGIDPAELKKKIGINGESRLSLIGSIDFPKSFPLDLMHVLFENIMPQLLSMWEGNFKAAMITGEKNGKLKEDYVISAADWHTINTEVLKSNATTPAQLSRKVGSITARGYWNADTYAHFLMFLGPIVLKGRLPERYYKHFILLSETVQILIGFDIQKAKLDALATSLVLWVQDFERLYYRYDPKYLSLCTAPIHALLHVVTYIRWQGPPSQYWCFAMERYGGWVKAMALDNKKKAIIALSNRVLKEERILQFMKLCSPRDMPRLIEWQNRLEGRPVGKPSPYHLLQRHVKADHPDFRQSRFFDNDPCAMPLSHDIMLAIKAHLQTRGYNDAEAMRGEKYLVPLEEVCEIEFQRWKAFDASTDRGSYRYRAQNTRRATLSEARDTSWVMYYQMVCKNPRTIRRPATWVMEKQWGQIEKLLTFSWRGPDEEVEDVEVAVIQPWIVEDWITNPKVSDGPQLLKKKDGTLLQVVDVHFLASCAGHVTVKHVGYGKERVIFEKTMGTNVPQL